MAIEEASASSRKEGRKSPVPIGANIEFPKRLHLLHANIKTRLK